MPSSWAGLPWLTAVLLATPTSGADPAAAQTRLDSSVVLELAPGESTDWLVDIDAGSPAAESRQVAVRVTDPVTRTGHALSEFLDAEISWCAPAWADGRCPAGSTVLAAAGPISMLDRTRYPLVSRNRTAPVQAELRLRVTFRDVGTVAKQVQGATTRVRIQIDSFGAAPVAGSGALPDTGARLVPSLFLGLGAVLSGLGLCHLVRRRRLSVS